MFMLEQEHKKNNAIRKLLLTIFYNTLVLISPSFNLAVSSSPVSTSSSSVTTFPLLVVKIEYPRFRTARGLTASKVEESATMDDRFSLLI